MKWMKWSPILAAIDYRRVGIRHTVNHGCSRIAPSHQDDHDTAVAGRRGGGGRGHRVLLSADVAGAGFGYPRCPYRATGRGFYLGLDFKTSREPSPALAGLVGSHGDCSRIGVALIFSRPRARDRDLRPRGMAAGGGYYFLRHNGKRPVA